MIWLLVMASAVLTATAIPLLLPLMRRYAMARPNARSSHVTPTPQGAGLAVVGALILVTLSAQFLGLLDIASWRLTVLLLAIAGLALVGWRDDIKPMGVLARMGLQTACVVAVVSALPDGFRILPESVPHVIELVLLILAGIYVVNITNFMDGIDWMSVVQIAPLSAITLLLWSIGAAPALAAVLAAGLLGAMLGFAPFNVPGARRLKVFLGDVGSLPIGLVVFAIAVLVAREGHLVPALLTGLYYIMDATVTLFRRAMARKKVWEAHREHFYQRATVAGLGVSQIVARVLCLNLVLGLLAILAALSSSAQADAGLLAAGMVLTALALIEMVRQRGPAGA